MIRSSDVTITTVFDNYPYREGLKSLWGFACYIEMPQRTILFDTGSNGRVLLKNMEQLGKAVEAVDTLFISHSHWDHIGGLDSVIERNSRLEIVAPASLSKLLIRDLKSMVGGVKVATDEGSAFADGCYTTGMMGNEVPEHSLILDTDEGATVITGCAHSGIVAIAERAQALLGKRIDLLIGGFHLMHEDEASIDRVIDALSRLQINRLCPTHCSGDRAKERFREAFGERYLEGGLGSVIRGA